MSTQDKGKLIGEIIATMRAAANHRMQSLDEGDMFFSLAFKSDKELIRIAKLAHVKA